MEREPTFSHFPRPPLYGAIFLVLFTLTSVALIRVVDIPKGQVYADAKVPLETRRLVFMDQPNGSILVTDGDTGGTVAVVKPGTNGFLRGALRGIVRERRRGGGVMATPFILARWPNGHITLNDPDNKTFVDFSAFGPTNAAVFAAFMPKSIGVAAK
jgi:putative photosynthetic complex assembly protein